MNQADTSYDTSACVKYILDMHLIHITYPVDQETKVHRRLKLTLYSELMSDWDEHVDHWSLVLHVSHFALFVLLEAV